MKLEQFSVPRRCSGERQQVRGDNFIRTAGIKIKAGLHIAAPGMFAVIALLHGSATGASDAVAAGRLKADQVCANCHGLDGRSGSGGNSAMSPQLTAQSQEYLVARLNAYRSGSLEHPQMTLVARMISEQDIENVSAWYSSLEIALSGNASRPDAELAPAALAGKAKAEQVCRHCHGIDGRSVPEGNAATVPYLSGQPREYLIDRMRAYRSGRIDHPQMSPIAKSLSEQEIAEVADWYAGIELDVLDFD